LACGVSIDQLALDYFAKAGSSSSGRQMPSHFNSRAHNVVSLASPTALQCLAAAGAGWASKLDGSGRVSLCCVGDASIRQGEFYEAYCFAIQESLPVVFVVEDNGFGISTRTERLNPLRIGALSLDRVRQCSGVQDVFETTAIAIDTARRGMGP